MIPKFRAWIKSREVMINVSLIDFSRELITVEYDTLENAKKLDYHDTFSLRNVELMQSTGILDTKGNEIYEGDILEIRHLVDVDSLDTWSTKGVIRNYTDVGYPAFDIDIGFIGDENTLSLISQSGLYSYEVIGNIWEDGELLEVK